MCECECGEGQGKTRALIQVFTSHLDVRSTQRGNETELQSRKKSRAATTATAQIRHRNIAFIWLLNKVHFVYHRV